MRSSITKLLLLMLGTASCFQVSAKPGDDSLKEESSDSLSYLATDSGAAKESGASTPAPTAVVAPPTTAKGISLLPARPEAEFMTFSATPAAEVALRFAREYRTSVILVGDGAIKITASVGKNPNLLVMLREAFPAPTWSVVAHAGSYIISAKSELKFNPVTFSSISSN